MTGQADMRKKDRPLIAARTKSLKHCLKHQSRESQSYADWVLLLKNGAKGHREDPPEAAMTWLTIPVTVMKTEEI